MTHLKMVASVCFVLIASIVWTVASGQAPPHRSKSPVKRVFSPYHKRHVAFGARPASRPPAHFFREYLTRLALPAPPASADFRPLAGGLDSVMGNDVLGCCVISARNHNIGVYTGNASPGNAYVATTAQIVSEYSAITGYVPGDESTDQGTDPVAALQWYAAHPAGDGSTLAGAIGFDATGLAPGSSAQATLMAAIDLFEGGWLTYALPDAWVNPMPSDNGFVWDVAGRSDPSNGHCTAIVGYNAQGVIIDTWGMTGTVTWAAVAAYCTQASGGMVYFELSTDQVVSASQQAPNGFNWSQLVADFPGLGGSPIVTPTPGPAPGPTPTPTPVPVPVPAPPTSTIVTLQFDPVALTITLPSGWGAERYSGGPQIVIHPNQRLIGVPRGWSTHVGPAWKPPVKHPRRRAA
jgi:hypothetical protein